MLSTRTPGSSNVSAPLVSTQIEVDDDPLALYELSLREGWGDGLPLLPATQTRVAELIAATPWQPDDVICKIPPRNGMATVEKAAINAAMAGVEPAAFPYVVAALEAITQHDFNLFALSTTTSSVMPMFVVNGPARDELGFDYGAGCMGGAAGRGSSTVGRAVQLCMRNIGGQKVGLTSKSVFGQPGRSSGVCFGEWEERSPWPSLAEQRGFSRTDEIISAHGGKGAFPFADVNTENERDLLYLIAKTISFPMANKFLEPTAANGEVVVLLNPAWAQRFGREFPDIADAIEFTHSHCWIHIDFWPEPNQRILYEKNRVDDEGRVWLNERASQLVFVVCGGLGNLHAICLPSWGASTIQSAKVVRG